MIAQLSGALPTPHERQALLALLVTGHLLADFVFQTRAMVERKARSGRVLALHGLEVLVVQTAAVLWFAGGARAVALLLGIALSHVALDRAKCAAERRWPRRPTTWLLADQAAHLLVLLCAFSLWRTPHGHDPGSTATVLRAAIVVGAYALNVNGGSALVTALLAGLRPPGDAAGDAVAAAAAGPAGAGRLIGILERVLILTLVALDQWSAVGLVLTAKSVARFKRLEEQSFAEAYLIGTMTSVLVAMASGLVVRAVT